MSGITFRNAIDANKREVIKFLTKEGSPKYTRDICDFYNGEKEMTHLRTALKELRKEGKITTDDHVYFWFGKLWSLAQNYKCNECGHIQSYNEMIYDFDDECNYAYYCNKCFNVMESNGHTYCVEVK